jgi:hypothetical protein
MPGNPMSDRRLHEKFLTGARAGGVGTEEARVLLAHFTGLENATSALGPLANDCPEFMDDRV